MPSRQTVYGRAGVATSQPLASTYGLQTLLSGGNAIDSAITIAAVLAVVEPCSNGIGGDNIALVYTAHNKRITAVHGNGASPSALTAAHFTPTPDFSSPHTITVPGAVAAWDDLLQKHGSGKFTLSDLLEPALQLAEHGFAVGPITASAWAAGRDVLMRGLGGEELLIEGRVPREGEIFRNKGLARALKLISERGKKGFYEGEIAEAIVSVVKELGGVLSLEDLKAHSTEFRDALSVGFHECRVHEPGLPTQGVVALVALGILDGFKQLSEVDMMHVMVECVRLAFAEVGRGVAPDEMLSAQNLQRLREKVKLEARANVEYGNMQGGGTVQFCVIDAGGNAVSMVQSNYQGFGTGHVARGFGFTLQNRGLGFISMGRVSGGRKPFHTIIPAMVTRQGALRACVGVMGGFMQPQGHLQVIKSLSDGYSAQEALDRPRFKVVGRFSAVDGSEEEYVFVEKEMTQNVIQGLMERGHVVREGDTGIFGRGQILLVKEGGVEGGSDNRADGCAMVL